MEKADVVVVGGGAAGFFAAISCKKHNKKSKVILLERSERFLAKVSISGGGRCNVCHDETSISKLSKAYPRGEKFLKTSFSQFSTKDTITWFEDHNVKLKTEEDGRMFPTTDKSATIVDTLIKEAKDLKIDLRKGSKVSRLQKKEGDWLVDIDHGEDPTETIKCAQVIVASGGAPKAKGLEWLERIGCPIIPPVPSIFSFNMPREEIISLQGIVAPKVHVRVQGFDYEAEGPVLVTHWGLSGPAILRLSAFAARELNASNYKFTTRVRWVANLKEDEAREKMEALVEKHPQKQVSNECPFTLPLRLWNYLVRRAGVSTEKPLGELGKKGMNKLIEVLLNDSYTCDGRTAFKEEFVTAGGVANASINPKTMESSKRAGLFLAGEVINIDGITGGFNFQAAWTTGWIAGKNASSTT